MHGHKVLTERSAVQIYFADPYSPWQLGSDEKTNGLPGQYCQRNSDLSLYLQEELGEIVLSLDTRSRRTLGFRAPLAVYTEYIARLQVQPDCVH